MKPTLFPRSDQLRGAVNARAARSALLLTALLLPLLCAAQSTTNGYLSLEANLPGVTYQVDGREFQEVAYLPLPAGFHAVRALWSNPVTGLAEQNREVEITAGEDSFARFDFPHGSLSLASNESYARFALDGVKLERVENLPLPPGTYTVTAVLPKAITGFGDYQISRPVIIEAGVQLAERLDFSYGTVSISASLEGTKYRIDGVGRKKVNKLRLPVGEHAYTALPPAPYTARSGSFSIRADEDVRIDLVFTATPEISSSERRLEYTWRFVLMPAATL